MNFVSKQLVILEDDRKWMNNSRVTREKEYSTDTVLKLFYEMIVSIIMKRKITSIGVLNSNMAC